jgi:hypothetical protein
MCICLKLRLVLPRITLTEKKAVVDEEKSIIKAILETGKQYLTDIFKKKSILATAIYHGVTSSNTIGTTSLCYFYTILSYI